MTRKNVCFSLFFFIFSCLWSFFSGYWARQFGGGARAPPAPPSNTPLGGGGVVVFVVVVVVGGGGGDVVVVVNIDDYDDKTMKLMITMMII